MHETEALEKEIRNLCGKPDEFRRQLEEFRAFKQRMVDAGAYHSEHFSIPLAHRSGLAPINIRSPR